MLYWFETVICEKMIEDNCVLSTLPKEKLIFSKETSQIADQLVILFQITNNFMVSCNALNKYSLHQGVKEHDIKFNAH
jgi:hypothetical protein